MRNQHLILSLLSILVVTLGCGCSDSNDRKSKAERLAMLELDRFGSKGCLEAIGQAIFYHIDASSNPDVTPPSTLEQLIEEQSLQPQHLISGMSGRDPHKVTIDEHGVLSEPSDYIYIVLPKNAPDTLIHAYEKPENYKGSPWGEGTLVLFKKRQYRKVKVEWMDIKSFRKALDQTNKWLAEQNIEPGWTNLAESKKNLRLIGEAIAYFAKVQNAPPSSLADIVEIMSAQMTGYALPTHSKFLRALVSPVSGRGPLKIDENGVPIEAGDYVYIPLPESAPSTLIQIYERPENYKGSRWGEGTLVQFFSKDYEPGEVKWLDAKSFQAALEQTQKWLAQRRQE